MLVLFQKLRRRKEKSNCTRHSSPCGYKDKTEEEQKQCAKEDFYLSLKTE